MEKLSDRKYDEFIKHLGISNKLLSSAMQYCNFVEEEPESKDGSVREIHQWLNKNREIMSDI